MSGPWRLQRSDSVQWVTFSFARFKKTKRQSTNSWQTYPAFYLRNSKCQPCWIRFWCAKSTSSETRRSLELTRWARPQRRWLPLPSPNRMSGYPAASLSTWRGSATRTTSRFLNHAMYRFLQSSWTIHPTLICPSMSCNEMRALRLVRPAYLSQLIWQARQYRSFLKLMPSSLQHSSRWWRLCKKQW